MLLDIVPFNNSLISLETTLFDIKFLQQKLLPFILGHAGQSML